MRQCRAEHGLRDHVYSRRREWINKAGSDFGHLHHLPLCSPLASSASMKYNTKSCKYRTTLQIDGVCGSNVKCVHIDDNMVGYAPLNYCSCVCICICLRGHLATCTELSVRCNMLCNPSRVATVA